MSFAEDFARGLQMGRERQDRLKRQEEQRKQQELQNQLLGRNVALQDLELTRSLPTPQETLPPGIQGPPQFQAPQPITIPGIEALGVPSRTIERPPTQTDVLTQQRAAEEGKAQTEMETFEKRERLKKALDALNLSPEVRKQLNLPEEGPIDPGEAAVAAQAGSTRVAEENARASREATRAYRDLMNETKRTDKVGKDANTLRDDYKSDKIYKDYNDMAGLVVGIDALAQQRTGAADKGMVNAYMKLIDPGSRVTAQEEASIENAAGVPDRIRRLYNNILRGEGLPEQARQEIVAAAHEVLAPRAAAKQVLDLTYQARAQRAGVNPEDVILPDLLKQSGPVGGGGEVVWERGPDGRPRPVQR